MSASNVELKWPLPEELRFLKVVPRHLRERLKDVKSQGAKKCTEDVGEIMFEQFKHQAIVTKFMSQETPMRGMLMYHETGVGKTCSLIGIAEANPDRIVVVMLPAALKPQFVEAIKFCGGPKYKVKGDTAEEKLKDEKRVMKLIDDKYIFISSNASQSGDLLHKRIEEHETKRLIKKDSNVDDNGEVGDEEAQMMDNVWDQMQEKNVTSLDNKLLIVDEAHSLISNIASPFTKNGDKIRDAIESASNLKIVLATGTPIIGDPFELAVLFNLIAGKRTTNRGSFYPFPQKYGDFHDVFVDRKTNKLKNKALFQERINGLVSYYSSVPTEEEAHLVPSLDIEVIEIPMSDYQWSHYVAERTRELEDERRARSRRKTVEGVGKIPNAENSGSYKMGTRQISNFVFPQKFPKPMPPKGNKTSQAMRQYTEEVQRVINQIPESELTTNLTKYSPKMADILYILQNTQGKVLIYSDFLKAEGLGVLARVLNLHGYKKWKSTPSVDTNVDSSSSSSIHIEDGMSYAVWSGDTPQVERNKIKSLYNNLNVNKFGEKLRILMITSAGAEGLDLKGVETVIIMEPYWHKVRMRQVIGRAQRICSHVGLPPDRNHVKVYVMVAVPPPNIVPQRIFHIESEKYTTDQQMLVKGNKKRQLLDEFQDAMKSMAFDCSLNWDHNKNALTETCRTCVQTGDKLGVFPADFDIHKQRLKCLAPDTKKLVIVKWNGIRYGLDEDSRDIYDVNQIPAIIVGKLNKNDDIEFN